MEKNVVYVKVGKESVGEVPADKIRLYAAIRYNGQRVVTSFDCIRQLDFDPIGHHLYAVILLKNAEMQEIIDVAII